MDIVEIWMVINSVWSLESFQVPLKRGIERNSRIEIRKVKVTGDQVSFFWNNKSFFSVT